jgi:hypothetical protein
MNRRIALVAALLPLSSPAAADVPRIPSVEQSEDEAALAELRAAVADMRATMLRPGERVEGWDRGGADPDSVLRARGADRHYFLTRGPDGVTVTILTDRPITDFAPSSWQVIDSYGSAGASLPSPQLDFGAFSPRYVMASRSQFRRVNDVDCQDNLSHALLFEVPGAPARPGDEIIPFMFRMIILALEDQMICFRSDGDAERGYRGRFFLPDGRALPELDDEAVSRIVPAAPIERLIEPPPPQPSEDDDGPAAN